MAKLPIKLKEQMERVQNESIPTIASHIARINAGCEHLPSWITNKTVDYYKGLLDGEYSMIERCLHAYNCYHGYMEADGSKKVGSKEYYFTYNRYSF